MLRKLFIIGLFVITIACEQITFTHPKREALMEFKLGDEQIYIETSTESLLLDDKLTGEKFWFPNGKEASLSVRTIKKGPEAPFDGIGFYAVYSGSKDIYILVDPEEADYVCLLAFGETQAAWDDEMGSGPRWFTMPCIDTVDGQLCFPISPNTDKLKSAMANDQPNLNHYWITKKKFGSDENGMQMNIRMQSREYIDVFMQTIDPSIKQAVTDLKNRKLIDYQFDGNYYKGFWWRSLGSLGRSFHPSIHLKLNVQESTIAHETGHYCIHILVGDDVQSTLEGQANLIYEHNISDDNKREKVLEEYAYFLEHFFTKKVASYELKDPYKIITGNNLNSGSIDIPGVEGFGALMLFALVSEEKLYQNLKNPKYGLETPVVGMNYRDVFNIIAKGATNINDLRTTIEQSITPEQLEKWTVILHRMGWEYTAKGQLVDEQYQPLTGVDYMENQISIDGKEYTAGWTSNVKSDGSFLIVNNIFPGKSRLMVVKDTDTAYVDINMDWRQPTNVQQDLGQLVVSFNSLLDELHQKNKVSITIEADFWDGSKKFDHSSNLDINMKDITWNNREFTITKNVGDNSSSGNGFITETMTGTFSNDGKMLQQLSYTFKGEGHKVYESKNEYHWERDVNMTIQNIPYDDGIFHTIKSVPFMLRGIECQNHISIQYSHIENWKTNIENTYTTTLTSFTFNTVDYPAIRIYFNNHENLY